MVIKEKSTNNLSGLYIIYDFSACNETEGYRGISHLIEHVVCCSLDEYQSKFLESGLTFNAFTDSEKVIFYLTGVDSYLFKYYEIFLNLVINPIIKEEDFLKEKNIVIQELTSYYLDVQERHIENYLRRKYGFYGPGGLVSDLENLNFRKFFDYYKKNFYRPNRILLISQNPEQYDLNFINFKDREKILKINELPYKSIPNFREEKTNVIFNLDNKGLKEYENEFLSLIFSNGLSSPFYKVIREKNHLTYSINSNNYNVYDRHINITMIKIDHDNLNKLLDSFNEIFENKEKYFTSDWFNSNLNMLKINELISENYLHSKWNHFLNDNSLSRNLNKFNINWFNDVIYDLDFDSFYISMDEEF
jgi:predicted Zn-dependent peptidase